MSQDAGVHPCEAGGHHGGADEACRGGRRGVPALEPPAGTQAPEPPSKKERELQRQDLLPTVCQVGGEGDSRHAAIAQQVYAVAYHEQGDDFGEGRAVRGGDRLAARRRYGVLNGRHSDKTILYLQKSLSIPQRGIQKMMTQGPRFGNHPKRRSAVPALWG